MDKVALKALKGAIKKWQGIVKGTEEDKGSLNCPLCKLYLRNDCNGCPVAKKTGVMGCKNTPFDDWIDVQILTGPIGNDWFANTPERLKVAKKELAFLKSLLPKRKKK